MVQQSQYSFFVIHATGVLPILINPEYLAINVSSAGILQSQLSLYYQMKSLPLIIMKSVEWSLSLGLGRARIGGEKKDNKSLHRILLNQNIASISGRSKLIVKMNVWKSLGAFHLFKRDCLHCFAPRQYKNDSVAHTFLLYFYKPFFT